MTTGTRTRVRRHASRPPAVLNAVILGLLRSPLHVLLDPGICEVRYRGRRSGRTVALPVIYTDHGGAYVVFSRVLNQGLEVAALEGSYASVIGGAPAAAVVFAGEVEARTRKDPRLQELNEAMSKADAAVKGRLRAQYEEMFKIVQSEKLGEMAAEFDRVHSVQRALAVGALHHIIPPAKLRPYLIEAVERGIAREMKLEIEKGNGKSDANEIQMPAAVMVA